jgi:PqqD family protein of HPr-rel-A system
MFQKLKRRFVSRFAPAPAADAPAGPFAVRTLRVSPDARSVADAGSVAVFHTGSGLMFKANATGARIWAALATQDPMDRLVRELARDYGIPEVQAECDVAAFLDALKNAGLVTCGD